MAIHLSTGVSTLVALMAAHRASAARGEAFTQSEIADIETRLEVALPLESSQETARSRTPRRTGPSTDATDSA
jgi:hypothetical protein